MNTRLKSVAVMALLVFIGAFSVAGEPPIKSDPACPDPVVDSSRLWKPSVREVVLPPSQFFEAGAASFRIPQEILSALVSQSSAVEFVQALSHRQAAYVKPEGPLLESFGTPENSGNLVTAPEAVSRLVAWLYSTVASEYPELSLNNVVAGMQRVDAGGGPPYETNHFHYDLPAVLGVTNAYARQNYFVRQFRENPRKAPFIGVTAIPLDKQATTVVIPFGGDYRGQHVQSPFGYITIVMVQAVFHRAHAVRYEGNENARGLIRLNFKVDGAPDSDEWQFGWSDEKKNQWILANPEASPTQTANFLNGHGE